jgi:hypothetical protein
MDIYRSIEIIPDGPPPMEETPVEEQPAPRWI